MKLLTVTRFCTAPDDMGTFGILTIDAAPDRKWYTVERPWKNNEPGVSCIPTGHYKLRKGTFMAGGGYPDLELVDVPGRANIEVHAANYAKELKGCIAPGKALNLSQWMVAHSRDALDEILMVCGDDDDLALAVQWSGQIG